jgi:hypothetical protein
MPHSDDLVNQLVAVLPTNDPEEGVQMVRAMLREIEREDRQRLFQSLLDWFTGWRSGRAARKNEP